MSEQKYVVIENTDRSEFESKVSNLLKNGYKLQGGVNTDVHQGQVMYYQALVFIPTGQDDE